MKVSVVDKITKDRVTRDDNLAKVQDEYSPNSYEVYTNLRLDLEDIWKFAQVDQKIIPVPEKFKFSRKRLSFLNDHMKGSGVNYVRCEDQPIWLPYAGLQNHLEVRPYYHPQLRKYRKYLFEIVKSELGIEEYAFLNDSVLFNPFTQDFSPYEASKVPKLPSQDKMEKTARLRGKRAIEFALEQPDVAEYLDHKFLKDSFVSFKDVKDENGTFWINEEKFFGYGEKAHPRNVVFMNSTEKFKRREYEKGLEPETIIKHYEYNSNLTYDKLHAKSDEEILSDLHSGLLQILTCSFRRNDLTGMDYAKPYPSQKPKANYFCTNNWYRSGKIDPAKITAWVNSNSEMGRKNPIEGGAIKTRSINSANVVVNGIHQPLIRAHMKVMEEGPNHFPNTNEDYLARVTLAFEILRQRGFELLEAYHADQTQAEVKLASNPGLVRSQFSDNHASAHTQFLCQVSGRMYEYHEQSFRSGNDNTSSGNFNAGGMKDATFYYYVTLYYYGVEVVSVEELHARIVDYHDALAAKAKPLAAVNEPDFYYIIITEEISVWKGASTDDMIGNFWGKASVNRKKFQDAFARAKEKMKEWEVNFDEPEGFGLILTPTGLVVDGKKALSKRAFGEKFIGPGQQALGHIAADDMLPGFMKCHCLAVKKAFSLSESWEEIRDAYVRSADELIKIYIDSGLPMDLISSEYSMLGSVIKKIVDQRSARFVASADEIAKASGKILSEEKLRKSLETHLKLY